MKGKLVLFLVAMLALAGVASATVSINWVKVDGDTLSTSSSNTVQSLDRGQDFEVKVKVTSYNVSASDVQIEANLRGYDHDDLIEDITDVFDMKANVSYTKVLTLPLRQRMDQDRYKLRIRVVDRNSATVEQTYELEVENERHDIAIKDVIFSPENEVKVGRALLTMVRVHNYGKVDEEGIKVTVSIPELGLSASDYIDVLEKDGDSDDEATTEELYLRIPQCTECDKTYTVNVKLTYDDGDEVVSTTEEIRIVCDDTCGVNGEECPCAGVSGTKTTSQQDVTEITIGPETQDVASGESVVYPLTIKNLGADSRTYVVEVQGASWGTFAVSPSNVIVVEKGGTQTAYITASANKDAAAGQQMFAVAIKSGDKVLKQVTLKSNVVAGKSSLSTLRKALEIGFIVLIVLLVILGLIIGFNKLKGSDDEEGKEDTYY